MRLSEPQISLYFPLSGGAILDRLQKFPTLDAVPFEVWRESEGLNTDQGISDFLDSEEVELEREERDSDNLTTFHMDPFTLFLSVIPAN